jgi:hypothetical protein
MVSASFETLKTAIHNGAKRKSKMAAFHSQILIHAAELQDVHPAEFCKIIDVPATYQTEFRKMIAAARELSELSYTVQKK